MNSRQTANTHGSTCLHFNRLSAQAVEFDHRSKNESRKRACSLILFHHSLFVSVWYHVLCLLMLQGSLHILMCVLPTNISSEHAHQYMSLQVC